MPIAQRKQVNRGEIYNLDHDHTSVQISDSQLQRIDQKINTFNNCTILVLLRGEISRLAPHIYVCLGSECGPGRTLVWLPGALEHLMTLPLSFLFLKSIFEKALNTQ